MGIFAEGAGDGGPIRLRQPCQVRLGVGVLKGHLPQVLGLERQFAGEQFVIGHGEAVLIAGGTRLAAERFRRGVHRADDARPAGRRLPRRPGQAADEAEVGDLDVVAEQQQVVRLDVQVEEAVAEVHHVQNFGRFPKPRQQVAARHAGLAYRLVMAQLVEQAFVGQFHDDDEHAVDDLDAVHRQQERMTDGADVFEGLQLQFGVDAFGVEAVGLVADELDRLEEAAGRLTLPDLAEAALAERFEESVAGQGFRLRLQKQRHPRGPRKGALGEGRF